MDDHYVFVLSKCRKGDDETDDMDTKMTVKVEKHATYINRKRKREETGKKGQARKSLLL